MKHIYTILFSAVLFSLSFFSSCNYLDIDEYIYDRQTLDSVFQREDLTKQFLNGAAQWLPNESKLFTESWSPFGLGADEAFASWEDGRHAAMYLLLDHLLPTDNYFNNWGEYYKGIRRANLFLARQHECEGLSDMDRREFSGRAYFLLGYYYYLLLQQYGPVPIVTEVYSSDDSVEATSQERNTYEECLEYITECMLQAYELLPKDKREQTQQYLPTADVTLAVLSRIWLYAASPWYNGNRYYANWTTSDGRHFIPQTEDNSKWGKSAVYSKRIIDTGKYELYTYPQNSGSKPLPEGVTSDPNFYEDYPNGANGLDHYLSCMSTFTGETYAVDNLELIYYCNTELAFEQSAAWFATPYQLGGGNGFNVTQNMVDAFKMNDGTYYRKVSDGWESIGQSEEFGNALFTIVGNTPKMYVNREARFYAYIGYNHRMWKGTASTDNNHIKNSEVTYYAGSYTGGPNPVHPNDYNRTGYTCVKYIHPEDHMQSTGTLKRKVHPIFRYAEILLNYAEALNELEGSYTDDATGITVTRDVNAIQEAVNRVRYRAGLPGLSAEELATQESIREAIKAERRIEFAFEGRRYHDLRRWGEGNAYNEQIRGLDVTKRQTEQEEFYREKDLNSEILTRRVFTNKMYLYPIPKSVLDRNGKLVQNPGW